MNRNVQRFAGLLVVLWSLSHAVLALDLKVVHSGNWPPYSGEDLPEHGLAIDIVTSALARAGHTPHLRVDSLNKILEGSKAGTYDVFATPWYTSERDRYLEFSQPYLVSSIHFIKRMDSPFEYGKFDDLEGVKIGVIANYAYEEDFNQSPAIHKVREKSLRRNLEKLTNREIDLTLDDELVLRYTINRFMPESGAELQILDKPLVSRGVNIGVSRSNPHHADIVRDFDTAIEEMKRDGSYDRIIEKHRAYIDPAVKR